MSCKLCEEAEESGMVAYYRVDRANVGIIGCKEHVLKVFKAMEAGGINELSPKLTPEREAKK